MLEQALEQMFETPVFLWALLGLIPFVLWDVLRRWGTTRRRQIASVVVRTLLLAGIILALANPRVRFTNQVADVIFVVDRSASVPDPLLERAVEHVERFRQELSGDERAGLVFFDSRPEVVVYPGEDWIHPLTPRAEVVDETDVATALQVALGLIPESHTGRIVLFTDGWSTQGSTRSAVTLAEERGIPVWTVPIDPGFVDPAVAEVTVEERRLRPGETVSGSAVLRSGPDPASGIVTVQLGDETIAEQRVEIDGGGTAEIAFEHSLDPEVEPGMIRLDVSFALDNAEADLQAHNNQRSIGVEVGSPPRVLMIASAAEEVENLSPALDAERIETDLVLTSELSTRELDIEDYDLVVLGNVPAASTEDGEAVLPAEMIDELRRYVSAGGGLVVLGGDRAYELGGYGETALARVLPIDLQPRDPEVEAAVTMIIILDNSGSMGSWAEGGTKMDLADAAAVAAMQLLREFDYLGVMAVDDRVDWVVPLQHVEDRISIERRIRGIQAGGGGIYVYTSLREAYRQMRRVDTPLRHVILFSDAADSEEQVAGVIFGWGAGPNSYDLARSMRTEGITVSVIGIGYDYDQDTNFLRTLADSGGGRFYMTSRASELQTLFVEETQRLVDTVLDETPFRVRSLVEHPVVDGIEFRRSPRLQGFIELEPRETAEVVLTHPDGHPIMTTWRYGLGLVAAMAIDAGPRWSSRWLDWDGYPIFWTQLARWAMRRHEGDETAIEVAFDDQGSSMRIARRSPEGLTEVEGGVRAEMAETDESGAVIGRRLPVPMQILEPGLWEANLVTEPGKRYSVRVVDANDEVFAEHTFVSPPSAEFRHEGADQLGLTEMAERTGGGFAPRQDTITGELTSLTHHQPLWLYFLCGAIFLMPIDAFLRRPGRDS